VPDSITVAGSGRKVTVEGEEVHMVLSAEGDAPHPIIIPIP